MKYTGKKGGVVKSGTSILSCKFDLWNHSPDGFSWGYNGSGCTQLAKALLYDFAFRNGIVGPEDFAEAHYVDFRSLFIANIPMGEPWLITDQNIIDWLKEEIQPERTFGNGVYKFL